MGRRKRKFFGKYSGKRLLLTWGTLLFVVGFTYLHRASGFEGVEDYNKIAEMIIPVVLIIGLVLIVVLLSRLWQKFRNRGQ
jgi:hypothetical protein